MKIKHFTNREYTKPSITKYYFKIEDPIGTSSKVYFGGETNGQPTIEDQLFEEKHFEIEF